MMGITDLVEIVLGMVLRIAVPILLTLVVGWFLKHLDDRWRSISLHQNLTIAGLTGPVENVACWEAFNCSSERRTKCRAYNNPDIPCWEAVSVKGQLQEVCRGCPLRAGKMAAAAV